ncbi:hypothetical protein [Nodosilinea sp. FACHB-13]|uniref:hypothetical protein n=1 Tax=Cyanophyceae TaxID=3028117 RepID=UPI0016897855|nr:hypothetical protein [Nodosilinea sp. FACHB-13]MBD2110043.1 hypothetical protein [Nodosilinea sp. FACHB-13]
MFSEDGLAMKGRLHIQQFDRYGRLTEGIAADNAIVFSGRQLVAQMFHDKNTERISYLAIGTGSKPVHPDQDTTLETEVFRKKLKDFDINQDLTEVEIEDPTGEKKRRSCIRLSADLDFQEPDPKKNSDQPYVLQEAGLFTKPGENIGVMYNRVVFPPISKTPDFKLTLVWEIIF